MSIYQFSDLSIKLTKKLLSNEDKKKHGIYFTPFDIIKLTIDNIYNYSSNIKTILEPSCGSCEFINYIDSVFKETLITGIEYNDIIYDNIKDLKVINNSLNIINKDYLLCENDKYDLIIGNPPYYVIIDKEYKKTLKEYKKYYDGRVNIYILFIIHSLGKLNKNGILAFILPKNFLNCLYYNKLRRYIYENYKIINIIDCSNYKYIDTEQDTIIFIIKNISNSDILNNSDYVYQYENSSIIFNSKENIIKIRELYLNATTLDKLHFEVKVGTIVWNQHKKILTNDNTKTRLIYSSDILTNNLNDIKYKNIEKKNFIDKEGNNDLLLVINRGYGKGAYKLNYCLIDINEKYLIENHLICIKYKNNIQKEALKVLYENIVKSFNDERTNEFINIYFGNNAINTTELQFNIPIYI